MMATGPIRVQVNCVLILQFVFISHNIKGHQMGTHGAISYKLLLQVSVTPFYYSK